MVSISKSDVTQGGIIQHSQSHLWSVICTISAPTLTRGSLYHALLCFWYFISPNTFEHMTTNWHCDVEYPFIMSLFFVFFSFLRNNFDMSTLLFTIYTFSVSSYHRGQWLKKYPGRLMTGWRVLQCALSSRGSFKQCCGCMDLILFIFLSSPVFAQMMSAKERRMRQRKPHRRSRRHPAPILKPNPMSSHSACSSREFCMTYAAPRDKGGMGCCCPHGKMGVECVCTKASVCMYGGVSSSTTSPALGHWPLCKINIKNSGSVKMTPQD